MHANSLGVRGSGIPMSMPVMPTHGGFLPSSEPDLHSAIDYAGSEFDSEYLDPRNEHINVESLSIARGLPDSYAPAPLPNTYYPPRIAQPEYTYSATNAHPLSGSYYEGSNFDDIPSSPPSSPARHPPMPRNMARLPGSVPDTAEGIEFQGYNSLGITPSLIPQNGRVYPMSSDYTDSPSVPDYLPTISVDRPYERSPYDMGPPHQPHYFSEPHLGSTLGSSIPDLSPVLSDVHSPDSPPQHEGFTWQPILTAPRSEQSEAIIEQQRKPKQKRKSCLPEGVVDEYLGYTETEGTYICLYPNCLRLFKRTYNLRSHIQTHLCDRPYVCHICEANFVRPHDLRRHERCHTNDRPFVCPCGKGFNRQDAMQRHRMRDICEGSLSRSPNGSKSPKLRSKSKTRSQPTSPELAVSQQ